jgi:hypothetical protein
MPIAFGALTQDVANGLTTITGPTVTGSETWGVVAVVSSLEPSAAAWGGTTMVKQQGGGPVFFGQRFALFTIANPSTAAAITFTGIGTGNAIYAWFYTGVSGVRGSASSAIANVATRTLTQTTVSGDMVAGFAYTQAQDITITVGTARGTQQTDAESGRSRPFERAATTTSTDVTGTWTAAQSVMTGVVLTEAVGSVPTVSSIAPTSGAIGTSVTITGTNLTGATNATINGTAITSRVVVNATTITGVVASGTTTGAVVVTTPSGTSTGGPTFTVTAAPVLTSLELTNANVEHTLGEALLTMAVTARDQFGGTWLGAIPAGPNNSAGNCGVLPMSLRTITPLTEAPFVSGVATFSARVPVDPTPAGSFSAWYLAQLRAADLIP